MEKLRHSEIRKIADAMAGAGAVNLDLPAGRLLESVASSMPEDRGTELSLHILCCNEYFLVTGLTPTPIETIREQAADMRGTLG